jgi:signal transduction histidine kinase
MTVPAASFPPPATRGPGSGTWLGLSTVVWGAVALGFLFSAADRWSHDQRWLCFGVSASVEAGLFIAAALRRDLSPRLRESLGIIAASFVLTALSYFYGVFGTSVGLPAISDTTDAVITVLTYAVGVWGLLRWPMRPLSRTRWWQFGVDATIGMGGMVLFFAALITLPGTAGSIPEENRRWVLTYGAALLLDLLALNVLLLRGLALPTRRAYWLYLTALILEIVSLVVSQYLAYAHPEASTGGGSDAIYIMVQLLYVQSGVLLLRDPNQGGAPSPVPAWMDTFNPLPLLAVTGVGALVLQQSRGGDPRMLGILAAGLVGLVALFAVRLTVTAWENLQLLRAETVEERRRQTEKMGAIGRLAGGIAHEFNNLMTTVMGHAELGAEDVPADSSAREDFNRILEAGSRAAGLTNQLLAFSGQQVTQLAPMDLGQFVRQRAEALAQRVPESVTFAAAIEAAPAMVMGDERQLELALDQLVGNAVAAMPAGGRLTLGVRLELLERALETAYLSVSPGGYVVLTVEDTGAGIAAADLPRIFDPFFSTRPMHAAAGLGLAAVYGIVAAHDGGITVESAPGRGTTLRLYLPRL